MKPLQSNKSLETWDEFTEATGIMPGENPFPKGSVGFKLLGMELILLLAYRESEYAGQCL